MNKRRTFLFRAGAILILLVIAGAMFVVGRGHTVYMDNKTLEYGGQTYSAPYKVVVSVKDKQVAKLYAKERGMSTWIGQRFAMSLEITDTKGGDERTISMTVPLPHNMDGILINLPALLAGLPEEAYLSEFVIAPVENVTDEVVTDEFGVSEEPLPAE